MATAIIILLGIGLSGILILIGSWIAAIKLSKGGEDQAVVGILIAICGSLIGLFITVLIALKLATTLREAALAEVYTGEAIRFLDEHGIEEVCTHFNCMGLSTEFLEGLPAIRIETEASIGTGE